MVISRSSFFCKTVFGFVFFLLFPCSLAFSKELSYSLAPYVTALTYSNDSFRDHGKVMGIYGKVSNLNKNYHEFEAAFEQTDIAYINNTDLTQFDITALYSITSGDGKYSGSLGTHLVHSSDEFNDAGATLILAGKRYINSSEFGMSAFVSSYDTYDAFQLSPYSTIDISNVFPSNSRKISVGTGLNWIYGDSHIEDITNDFSAEISLNHAYKNTNLQLYVWKGIQRYAVKERGFVVINTSEERTGGAGITLDIFVNENVSLRTSYSYEDVKEFLKTTRHSSSFLSLSYKF